MTAHPEGLSRRYGFRRVGSRDQGRLGGWLAQPHVAEWWSADDGADSRDDPLVSRWIVSLKERPFAYMQDYDPHGWPGHHFGHLPPGSRGIDVYIGEPDMIARGHGTGLLVQRLQALLAGGAPVVATDPHPGNGRAIAAYLKAGFRVAGEPMQTEWGLALPMEARPPR